MLKITFVNRIKSIQAYKLTVCKHISISFKASVCHNTI